MKYTVIWTTKARDELAEIWLQALDRADVTFAADRIEKALKRMPNQIGESLFDTVRSYEIDPLAVEYEVIDEDRIVNVLSIWRS